MTLLDALLIAGMAMLVYHVWYRWPRRLEEAARNLGIDVKRLRGYVWRNSLRDPIGDADFVYGWSCKTLADTSTAAVIPGTTTATEAGEVGE